MTKMKVLIAAVCIFAMAGFEVARDLSIFFEVDSDDVAMLSTMTEEDQSEKESKAEGSTVLELDIDYEELSGSFFMRACVSMIVMSDHALSYLLLEQKVIIPPPEFAIV